VFLYADCIFNLTAAGRKQKENMNILYSFMDKVNIMNINKELILTYTLYLLINYYFTVNTTAFNKCRE